MIVSLLLFVVCCFYLGFTIINQWIIVKLLVIAELPLEYQRNFLLLEELEQTQQGK